MVIHSVYDYFKTHSNLEFHDGVFYQSGLSTNIAFEKEYLFIRRQEGRLYSDKIVMKLPSIPGQHPLADEWLIRKDSTDRLISYLEKKRIMNLLEVGCGNGWMTNYLFQSLKVDCCGVDINETELHQAARLFASEKVSFLYADVLSPIFSGRCWDIIILGASVQYFPDLPALIARLKKMLNSSGEIHIVDSPFYDASEIKEAKIRSLNHFDKIGNPDMSYHYFHHSWDDLQNFKYEILYSPKSFLNRSLRFLKLVHQSPFPWIKITANAESTSG